MAESPNSAEVSDAQSVRIRHWSIYGRSGQPQTTRVQPPRDDRAKPFSKPTTAPWRIALNPQQLQTLLLGFQPQQMEDKWIVFAIGPDAEGNLSVHMHRSWTGFKIIRLDVKVSEDGDAAESTPAACITDIAWETDEQYYRAEDEQYVKQTARGVCVWVMGLRLGPEEEVSSQTSS